MIFDLINFRPGTLPGDHGGGMNDVAGFNIHTIALSVPIQNLTKNHSFPTDPSDPNAIISMWSSTWRRATTTLSASGEAPSVSGDWVQVSRLGNPARQRGRHPDRREGRVQRDLPRRRRAVRDVHPRSRGFRRLLKALFNIDSPPAPRNDLLALVQGLDGLTRRPGEVISDQLRLNVAVFPTPILRSSTAWASSPATWRASRTDGVRMTTSSTSSCASSPECSSTASTSRRTTRSATASTGPTCPSSRAFPFLDTPHSGYDRLHDNAPTITQFARVRPATRSK